MPGNEEKIQGARNIVEAFFSGDDLVGVEIEPLGKGHINESFLLRVGGGGNAGQYVLQKINRRVFPEPEEIMANLRTLAGHFDRYGVDRKDGGLETIRPLSAIDGKDYAIDHEGNYWRAINYVKDVVACEKISSPEQAGEVGRALGLFHRLTSNLDPASLADTLPGFHVTPEYLAQYDRLMENPAREVSLPAERYCLEIISGRRGLVDVLEEAAEQNFIRCQVIHGDPKLDNILFDRQTGKAVALIDLDTVKPGLLHYDIGDCLRSSCSPIGDSGFVQDVVFDLGTCREVLQEYFREMAPLLTEKDLEYIFPAVRLITFELGLRFFSDYMAGDVYFKTTRAGQNLHRAMVQFALLESIERLESPIRGIITQLSQLH